MSSAPVDGGRATQPAAARYRRSPTAPPASFFWTRRIFLGLLTAFVVLPVFVMVSSSLKPLQDVSGEFRWIPSGLTIRPYLDIWTTVPLARYFVNSLIVAGLATVCSVVIAVFAAYAVSRYDFPGRRFFTVSVLSTQMFPGILFLLPLFLIYVNIGRVTGIELFGSRGGLILTYLTFSLPFSIWMLIGYFDSVPRELDEAAKVDGCGPLGALVRVIIPAAVPGIVAVTVYAFMTAWGEVLFASVMTNDTTRTLAVGLQGYATQNDVYWNQVMAASLVVSVPVVVGFLLLQRYLVAGLTAGAVK
ncbi:carbohydrate ABC transporter permease [Streptomyces sp. NPDC060194]|uniref:carbohydrate ABC transporter permease n=1 Tax=Streptomyces sp. NPDC060194 TaxID=3347069 RepID=UPI0036490CA9